MEFALKAIKTDKSQYLYCFCVFLLSFSPFWDYSTILRPVAILHRFTWWLQFVIDWCYTFPCAFHRLLFNFNSRWVIYLFHTMFLSLFTSRIRHRFLRVYEKMFAEDIFRVTTIFLLCVERKQRYQSMTTQIVASYQQTRAWCSFIPFGEQTFNWGGNNSLRGAKIPFLGAKIPLGEQ